MRWLIRMNTRRRELCGDVTGCPDVRDAKCYGCGHVWRPDDIRAAECPRCQSRSYERERCAECPIRTLDEAAAGPEGRLVARVSELDAARKSGFTLLLSDVTVPEFRALMILDEESALYRDEQIQHANQQRAADGAFHVARPD